MDELRAIAFILSWGEAGEEEGEDDGFVSDKNGQEDIEAQAFASTGLEVKEELTKSERREELAQAFCCLAFKPLDRTALTVFANFVDMEELSDLFVVIWEEPEPENDAIISFTHRIIDNLTECVGWLTASEVAEIIEIDDKMIKRKWHGGEPLHYIHFDHAELLGNKLQILARAYARRLGM
jgi:hypothetical protein